MVQSVFILILLTLLFMSGCSSTTRLPDSDGADSTEMGEGVPTPNKLKLSETEIAHQLELLRHPTQKEFRLGKGDVLSISVYNEPDLTVIPIRIHRSNIYPSRLLLKHDLTPCSKFLVRMQIGISGLPVRPDGSISFLLIGDVRAEGLTVEGLRETLTRELRRYIKEPKVSVIIQKFSSLNYTIVGEVVRPGVFPITTDVTLTQALAHSGGLNKGQFYATSVELADLQHAFIAREGQVLPVNFVALLRQGDMRHDIPLQPGDYIYIPSGLSQEIYVLGEVNRPDMFAFREGMSLSKAMVIANGFRSEADIGRVHLVRGTLRTPELFVVDLEAVLTGKERDIMLAPGDIVYVPPTGLTVWSQMINKILPTMIAIQGVKEIKNLY